MNETGAEYGCQNCQPEDTEPRGAHTFRVLFPDDSWLEVRADYAGMITAGHGGTALYLRRPDGMPSELVMMVPAISGAVVFRTDQRTDAFEGNR